MGKFKAMENSTLIFIPDISGFTDFVNTTAIEHSQHIISELLEIIIETNYLGFEISEIEGDAVLFYKKDEIPNSEEMIKLSKEMFLFEPENARADSLLFARAVAKKRQLTIWMAAQRNVKKPMKRPKRNMQCLVYTVSRD